jgi:hypothetical protein
VSSTCRIRGHDVPIAETLCNTEIATSNGLGALFEVAGLV